MSDPNAHHDQPGAHGSEEFDHELDVRSIVWATVGLTVVTLLSVAAMWGLLVGFNAFERSHAVAAAPMSVAHPEKPPEGARLQPSPPADMADMNAHDDQVLGHAGWVDQAKGTVRLPIDVAIDVVAERGLPAVTTPSLAAMAASGETSGNGRPPVDQPSPGTLLVPPGNGIGMIGPPSAGAGQVIDPATMGTPGSTGSATAAPAAPPSAAQAQPAPSRKPVLPPPPPPGGMP